MARMRITRRQAIAAAAAPLVLSAQQQRRPNIIYIMADDLGYADLSCYGRREYSTPNIDSLATAGVRFTQAYANSAVCSATRTALITGRYQYRVPIGLEEPLGGNSKLGLPPEVPTLPQMMKKAGYETSLIGKWHLGFPPDFSPIKSGYDHFYGITRGGVDYFTHQYGVRNPATEDLWDDETRVEQVGYLTDLLGDRAVSVINTLARGTKPFLLSMHFTAPHWPWEGPMDEAESQRLRTLADYDGGSMKTYAEMVTRMDLQVGRILKALEDSGAAGNTLVIFTSDNGGERFANTWPFTGKKTELLEGGLRVPAIVRWPGRVRAGTTTEQVAISMDWTATMLAAAGATIDPAYPLDGLDLAPQLMGNAQPVSRKLFWRYHFNQQRAFRDGDMKFLKIGENTFLFNVVEDPLERANQRDRQPEVYRRMVAEYENWNAGMLPDRADIASGPLGYADTTADHFGMERPRRPQPPKVEAPKPAN
jgi:arylsulfatase A-like enzyme